MADTVTTEELMKIWQAKRDSTQLECQVSETPSKIEPKPNEPSATVSSRDPEFAGLPNTPAPETCEFCGTVRYVDGIRVLGLIFWQPPSSCKCPEAKSQHKRQETERKARDVAEEKAKADAEMKSRVKRIIGESGLGERFLQRTFETFVTDTPDRKRISEFSQRYAREFDSKLPRRGEPLPEYSGILISGTKGTGKTHIAAAIANYLMVRGTAVICMTERNLFSRIQQTYSKSKDDGVTESAVRRIYETVPLLIIDDLGKERPTAWTLATLYAIIDGRYDRAMPTIITTNYDAPSLVNRFTPKGDDKITADAIVDRLYEMCKNLTMTGDSWRISSAHPSRRRDCVGKNEGSELRGGAILGLRGAMS